MENKYEEDGFLELDLGLDFDFSLNLFGEQAEEKQADSGENSEAEDNVNKEWGFWD